MSNLSALQLVAVHMDTSTLEVISKIPLWSIISPLFSNQYSSPYARGAQFWYLRAQTCVNFQLEWNSTENWHQVYNILRCAIDSNPFSTGQALSLPENGYNSTAVKLLLRLGYDPSVNEGSTRECAIELGSVEILQLLLSDTRCNTSSKFLQEALDLATKLERLDILRALFVYIKRVDKNDIDITCIRTAVESNKLEALKLLDEELNIGSRSASRLITIAAERGSLDVLKFLMCYPGVDVDGIGCSSTLEHGLHNNNLEVVSLLLSDKRTLISDRALNEASYSSNPDIKHLVLSDYRASAIILTKYLQDILMIRMEARTLEVVIRREDVCLQDISYNCMRYIVESVIGYLQPCVEQCVGSSGEWLTIESLVELICTEYSSYEEHHYQMLLKELILKRCGINYYLNWMTNKALVSSREIRETIIQANEVHTSEAFTAYRAFWMLRVTGIDKNKIILQLSGEEGVTAEGLQLACMLLGAYTM